MKFWLLLILALAGCGDKHGSVRVVGIVDGDTIDVLQNGEKVRVRLAEIDCPERKQPFSTQAKELTGDLAFGKNVVLMNVLAHDRYGRIISEVELPNGKILNHELVQSGLAWRYTQYSKDSVYGQLEAEARKAKRGLWSDPHPVPPWKFRKKKSAVVR